MLRSDAVADAGELRFGKAQCPILAYLLNRCQMLCTLVCTLSYLSAEGFGYTRWSSLLGKYMAAELLNHLADYTTLFGFCSILLGPLSALLFTRGTGLKFALAILSLVLCVFSPSYGVA